MIALKVGFPSKLVSDSWSDADGNDRYNVSLEIVPHRKAEDDGFYEQCSSLSRDRSHGPNCARRTHQFRPIRCPEKWICSK